MNANAIRRVLKGLASDLRAQSSARFFKTAPGQYGHGDKFLGITVPQQRKVARQFRDLPLGEVLALLKSPWHEERLTALIILVGQFQRANSEAGREAIVKAYLKHLKWVNNWDLVDSSAGYVLGVWLRDKDRGILYKLVKSKVLWERRVAMIATQGLINAGQSKDALQVAAHLLDDPEDLMHKASGWMLREVGKRVSLADLRGFLAAHAGRMPRTMLRYAIERLPPSERQRWMGMAGKRGAGAL
jgi:3-methyladenine DNA glycosylase AlkD